MLTDGVLAYAFKLSVESASLTGVCRTLCLTLPSKDIYDSIPVALFSGLFSPTRYFIEGMTVAESRCLPVSNYFSF